MLIASPSVVVIVAIADGVAVKFCVPAGVALVGVKLGIGVKVLVGSRVAVGVVLGVCVNAAVIVAVVACKSTESTITGVFEIV